jgi:pimeloyl-ACP methyl ester carboxylesterase
MVASFESAGLRLHYEALGEGRPVVLLHGFTSRGAWWKEVGWVRQLLRDRFRTVALDFPGHGHSQAAHAPPRCATDRLAADVIGLLNHLEIPRASIVGFSMGGGIALQTAMAFPRRVHRVVVAGLGDAALNELHDPADLEDLRVAFSPVSLASSTPANAARIRRNAELAGNALEGMRPYLEQGGWPGGLDQLRPLEVPTLLVLAEGDEYMRGAAAVIAAARPTCVLDVSEAGHHTVLRQPEVLRAAVDFLRLPAQPLSGGVRGEK